MYVTGPDLQPHISASQPRCKRDESQPIIIKHYRFILLAVNSTLILQIHMNKFVENIKRFSIYCMRN